MSFLLLTLFLCKTAGRVMCCPVWLMMHLQKSTYWDKFEVISVLIPLTWVQPTPACIGTYKGEFRAPWSIEGVSRAQRCSLPLSPGVLLLLPRSKLELPSPTKQSSPASGQRNCSILAVFLLQSVMQMQSSAGLEQNLQLVFSFFYTFMARRVQYG